MKISSNIFNKNILISIAVCTYKREHISQTMESLVNLNLPKHTSIEIIIVDNDPEMFASKIVSAFSQRNPNIQINYFSEPRKNISIARNCCLENSKGNWIAFIDDDEIASEDWILQLYNSAIKFNADVVVGRVISLYPEITPDWIIKGKFFDRKRLPTGTIISSCAANCTLVKSVSINKQKFNLEYGLSGGEDADFFHRMYKKNNKLIYCDEAIVSEEIEANRLCFSFLWKRKQRIGLSYSKYRYEDASFMKKNVFFIKTFLEILLLIPLILASVFRSKHQLYKILLKAADRTGKLKYFFSSKMPDLY